MADKLQGTWVFDKWVAERNDLAPVEFANWNLNFSSNGKQFYTLRFGGTGIYNNDYDSPNSCSILYKYPDGVTDADGKSWVTYFSNAAGSITRNEEYNTIQILSMYDEVANAENLYRALKARATHTPFTEDIEVPMVSAKGVMLKTAGKLCDRDIVVTPELEELNVTENGDYTPSKVGYGKVSVNVAATTADASLKQRIEGTITEVSDSTVTSIVQNAFSRCGALASVNMPNVTSIGQNAFIGCDVLTSVNMPNVTSIGTRAFSGCTKLPSVDFPNVTKIGSYAFDSCYALTGVKFPNVATIETYAFQKCSALASVDFSSATGIKTYAFNNSSELNTVILRGVPACGLANINAFTGTPFASGKAGGKLLVPRSLVESYKTATNWSVIWGYGTNQFLALEDYTVDGTITGEIDWDKLNGGTTA